MGAPIPLSPLKAFRGRVKRYVALRAAQRALAAAAPLPTRFQAGSDARESLRELETSPEVQNADVADGSDAEAPVPPPSREWVERLRHIDALLAAYEAEIRAAAEAIPLAQFRATLPQALDAERAGVGALLDVCIGEPETDRSRWLPLIDYVLTLLVAEDDPNGGRRVVSDPAQLTGRLRKLCATVAQQADPDALRLAHEVRVATDALAAGEPAADVIERVKAAKARIGEHYFHPVLLRAVVTYNVTASHRLRAEADSERLQDQIFCGRIGFDVSAALDAEAAAGEAADVPSLELDDTADLPISASYATPPAAAEDVVAEPLEVAAPPAAPVESVFESGAVRLLEETLRNRIRRQPSAPGPAARIVGALALGELKDWELAAFTGSEPEDVAAVIRASAVVGLVLRGDEHAASLAELGVDAAGARERWPDELERLMQHLIQRELNASGGYEASRRLSLTKSRLLGGIRPATSRTRAPLSERVAPAETAADAADVQEIFDAPEEANAAARSHAPRGRAPAPAAPRRPRKAGRTRWALFAVVAVALLVTAALRFRLGAGTETEKHPYSAAELAEISAHLVEGYSGDRGTRTVLVATVAPSWIELSAVDRKQEATTLLTRASGRGLSEIVLVDASHELQLHALGDKIRYLRAD